MDLDKVVTRISQSKKYRDLHEGTIRDICEGLLRDGFSPKEIEKQCRKKLHNVWQDYLGLPNYKKAKQELEEAFEASDLETVRNACINVMSIHESARERLVVLSEAYYQRIFEITGVPKIVTDLACAFHPFCFPWMNLPKEVQYNAYDINKNFVDLINHYFALESIQPLAHWQDIYSNPPEQHADVAFLFKMYHCLDHRKKGSGLEIIRNTKTDWMVISFPLQNLRGAKMIMYDRYSQPIEQLVESEGWSMHRLEFENEWLVLIHKA
ncbi:MAG: hypothetical protein R8G66_22295 [Cytophagales bacterium]|nr:hypothetical protein [Cytophagales bacterium]